MRELIEHASKIFTDFIRASLIRRVRTGGHLIVENQEDLLEQFAAYAWESATSVKRISKTVDAEAAPSDREDIGQRFGLKIRFRRWGRSAADEWCRLLEQVRLARSQR